MNTEKHSIDSLDADIQQSKADILRFLQQAGGSILAQEQNKDIKDADAPDIIIPDSLDDSFNSESVISPEGQIPEPHIEPEENESDRSLRDELEEKDRQIRELEGVLKSLEEQLDNEKCQYKDLLKQSEQAEQRSNNLDAKIMHLTQEMQELESKCVAFENQREQENSNLSRIAELEELKVRLGQEHSALANELAITRDKAAEIEHKLSEAQHQSDVVLSEKDILQNQIDEYNRASSNHQQELVKAHQQIDSLQNENQTSLNLVKTFENQVEQEKQKTEQISRQYQQRIAELEQLNIRLSQNNSTLSNELSASRTAAEAVESTIWQVQQKLDMVKTEKNALQNRIEELRESAERKQAELEMTRQELDRLNHEKHSADNLTAAFEHDIQSLQTQLEEQKYAAEQTCQQLRMRIVELDDQLTEYDQQSVGKMKEMEHLIAEQKLLLDKSEQQRRDAENRLASIQAENDRLTAACADMPSVHERLNHAEQQLETLHRKLERLKGDHQLVGEENNQLHQILHLRNQELERITDENKILKDEIAKFNDINQQLAEKSCPSHTETANGPVAESGEISDIESSEPETGIPDFNLAEQIMAEQRRAVGSQRQSPGGAGGAVRQDAVARVVGQFVGGSEKAESFNHPDSTASDFVSAVMTPPQPAEPDASKDLFAEIVRRDILSFLEQKRRTFQQPKWVWNKIN